VSSDRSYHSSLREEQALQTRLRIRRAARELFATQGFTNTTINQIAEAAGVSPATVYAVYESKAGIVVAMLEDLEESVGLGSYIQQMLAEENPRTQLRLFIRSHCLLFTEGADILRAAMRAIEDPHVAELAETGDQHRRKGIETLVGIWQKKGALRKGLSRRQAVERLWLLTTVESFLTAIDRLGWKPKTYERWLADLTEREMFGEEG